MPLHKLWIKRQGFLRGFPRLAIAIGGQHVTAVGLPRIRLRQARPGRGVARIALECPPEVLDCTFEVLATAAVEKKRPCKARL